MRLNTTGFLDPDLVAISTSKKIGVLFAAALAVAALLTARTALRTSLIAHYRLPIAGLPAGTSPLRIVQLSDIHAIAPDMPPSRVARIVAQTNALKPDLIVITGDFVSDRAIRTRTYSSRDTVAPPRALKAPLGVFAVLGNHDHWRAGPELAYALKAAGIHLLVNDAKQAGPIIVAGLDDSRAGAPDLQRVAARLKALPKRPVILLTHNPDVFPLLPSGFALVLAGHTHGGQIKLPLVGALMTGSAYGDRFLHGWIEERDRVMIVSAGLGDSILPFRFRSPPEIVQIILDPPGQQPR